MPLQNFRDAEQRLIQLIKLVKGDISIKPTYRYSGINDPISRLLGFDIKEQKLDGEYGLYINNPPGGDKPLVVIDPNSSNEERLNFTYFHEVSHHLIRADNELYGFLDRIATQNNDLKSLKEKFANIGAAEFLLPTEDVKEFIGRNSFSIKLLLELDKKYPASKPAIAIQLARNATHKCFVVICEYGPIPSKNKQQIRLPAEIDNNVDGNYLHVSYSASSPSNEYSIGKYTIIPKNHMLRSIFEQKNPYLKGTDLIPFKGKTEWLVQCEGLYHKDKVYAVFNRDSPPPPSHLQPELFKFPN